MRKVLVAAGLAALALLVGATAGTAQVAGLYYQEVEKDGRVYVFNTPERFASWSASGELGTAITLIGKAEGGKTLVGENETAVDLYLFKHDLPGFDRPTPKPERKFDERVYWRDGKTTIEMKQAKIQISNRAQLRYSYFNADDPAIEDRGTFNVRRMKTAIEGETADKAWKFKLQANWVGAGYATAVALVPGTTPSLNVTTRRGPELEDAEVWWQKHTMAKVWVGQGKVPFARQEYTSSGKQQFVDRWIGNALFAPQRDQGIRMEGLNEGKTFEYFVGVYNGIARNINLNDNDDYLYSGRAVWMPFGEYKYEESSLDYPDTPKLALGIGAVDNTLGTGTSAIDVWRLGYEAAFKWRGFNTVGEFFDEEAERGSDTFDNKGWYLQVGYLFPNRKLEVAARLADIDREQAFAVTNLGSALLDLEERGVAASWYLDKHTHKIQADYIELEDKRSDRTLDELRVQLQVIF